MEPSKPNNSLRDHWLNYISHGKLEPGDNITLYQNGNSPQEWGQLTFQSLNIRSEEPFVAELIANQTIVNISHQNPWRLKTIHRS